jgi:uncharacterized protein YdeI (BOF family)
MTFKKWRNAMHSPRSYISIASLGFVLGLVGVQGCATDYPQTTATIPPAPTVSQPAWHTLEGQVIRNEGDAYVVRDASGQQRRIFVNRNSTIDPVVVGDPVVVRYVETTGFANSIRRTTGVAVPSAGVIVPPAPILPRPQTVEGTVQRIEGNDYVIKDLSGREMRLQVDRTTKLDGNITAGDRVVALTNPAATDASYVSNMYILGTPGVVQGEVVQINGDSYVVREPTGREVRLNTTPSTVRNGNVAVGDRVIAYLGPSSTAHAESITRR